MESAIHREKQLKKWNREWKLRLVQESNPEWRDLWDDIVGLGLAALFEAKDKCKSRSDSRLRGNDGQK